MSEKDLVLSMQGNESMEDSAEVQSTITTVTVTITTMFGWSTLSTNCD